MIRDPEALFQDPEYASIEAFVEYLCDDDREFFDHIDLQALNRSLRVPVHSIKKALFDWGFSLLVREKEREFRGFDSNDHNRWYGNPCGGGSGWDSIVGMALTAPGQ